MTPRVSIVLPVWNAGATLARAVASIRAQSLRNWELLVVDDGSTDETPAILAALAREEPRLRVLARGHEGLVAALNHGIADARGEFIARMDADDEALPERLAAQAALLEARDDLGLAGCLVEFGGDRAASAGYALHVDWINSLVAPEEIALNRFVESPLAHPSVMFRRELVEKFGGHRAGDFPEDYELWLRWLDAGVRMAKVPQVLLRWNDPPRRASRIDSRYDPEKFFRVKAEWIAREIARRRATTPPDRRAIWVWGAGRPTRKRAAHLEKFGVRIAGCVDVDAKKATPAIGGTGVPVVTPREIPPPETIFVLGFVSSRGARELIRGELRERGFAEGRDFLMCA
ncbi:MAG TPA: glycosyltransferase family 2 protein [Opitutaceae bacterium]|nr:glycosyltransferase family 2 protein [Opitutaceae bacterium]